MEKTQSKVIKRKNRYSSIIWLAAVAVIAVGLLLFCQFYFGDTLNSKTTYYDNTYINGVNVSGMTVTEAENLISSKTMEEKENISITLKAEGAEWNISGDDLEVVGNYSPTLNKVMQYGRDGNVFAKKKAEGRIKKEGLHVSVPFEDIYGGLDEKLNTIITSIEQTLAKQTIKFSPNEKTMFSSSGVAEQKIVDKEALKNQINKAISGEIDPLIEVPLTTITPENDMSDFIETISLRGSFKTDFSKSTQDRKSNVSLALSRFNGMTVEPGEEVSFNKTTGPRTEANGYKSAKIIVGGKYVSGMGGGVCQASTTLYNALLLSDIEVLQVCHHTLPASYVPLSFDAMVSEGYADLVFKNTLDTPIFIKAYTTQNDVVVEIYGEPLEEGLTIQTKATLVKILPHGGDDIITDINGDYEDKVLYKGEYYRLKYPMEGYESKGYVQYIKDGEVIKEKEVRHDKYLPQNGIIVEGDAVMEEGMSLPNNSVRYISPQKVTQSNIDAAKARWQMG